MCGLEISPRGVQIGDWSSCDNREYIGEIRRRAGIIWFQRWSEILGGNSRMQMGREGDKVCYAMTDSTEDALILICERKSSFHDVINAWTV